LIALDTNVLVRVVTRDDPDQLAAALEVMRAERLWVAKSVLLELEWVLRYAYRLDPEVINNTFGTLLGLPNLVLEDRMAVIKARSWRAQGMDFADALHLASSSDAERFVTFDRPLAKIAGRLAAGTVQLLASA
jgi:predicted nucleic-acid-binding protein